jgi:PP-loop superfamily ATP-utilizing enzyme
MKDAVYYNKNKDICLTTKSEKCYYIASINSDYDVEDILNSDICEINENLKDLGFITTSKVAANVQSKKKIIGWWSGGATSTVACKIAIDLYGKENVRLIFIDTRNEDEDTYRFMKDCEKWYGLPIETISHPKFKTIQEVWRKYKALNNAKGAVCSSTLKRSVREMWEKNNEWSHQVFGFELDEYKRAKGLKMNHPHTNPIFPLMMYGLSKKDCIKILADDGLLVPITYQLGYLNNNCFKTGCTQGGIGYWQKLAREFPDKFNAMADMEHELTDIKGQPVTMLKDQSKGGGLVFLKPHLDYPNMKDISMMKGREPKPLFECNGLCGVNDIEPRSTTEGELNFEY